MFPLHTVRDGRGVMSLLYTVRGVMSLLCTARDGRWVLSLLYTVRDGRGVMCLLYTVRDGRGSAIYTRYALCYGEWSLTFKLLTQATILMQLCYSINTGYSLERDLPLPSPLLYFSPVGIWPTLCGFVCLWSSTLSPLSFIATSNIHTQETRPRIVAWLPARSFSNSVSTR